MPFIPHVSFFVPFCDLDPSKDGHMFCIYATQRGQRCRNPCSASDRPHANALRHTIEADPESTASLRLLEQYARLKCCKGHQINMNGTNNVSKELAERWQDEIISPCTTSHTNPVGPVPRSPRATPVARKIGSKPKTAKSLVDPSIVNITKCSRCATEAPTVKASSCPEYHPQTGDRLELRTVVVPACSSSREFVPHKKYPRPSDSVSSKLLAGLKGKDFKTGSLYIFARASSPDHVKIGWSAVSVPDRLSRYAKCGYPPILVYQVDNIPHAQQVERLVFHELLEEWRQELMCQGRGCLKSHKEWFEVSRDRAARVLRTWAEFMTEAEPYDSWGCLKDKWRRIVQLMTRNGEAVTGERMLEHHHASRREMPWPSKLAGERPGQTQDPWREMFPEHRTSTSTDRYSVTPHGSNARLNSTPTEENILTSILSTQLKIEKALKAWRSQATDNRQDIACQQTPPPRSETPVRIARFETTSFEDRADSNIHPDVLRNIVLDAVARFRNAATARRASSWHPGVLEAFDSKAALPVVAVA